MRRFCEAKGSNLGPSISHSIINTIEEITITEINEIKETQSHNFEFIFTPEQMEDKVRFQKKL